MQESFRARVKPNLLIYLIQRGLQYEELASQIDRDGTIREPARPFQFLPSSPTAALEEDEGVGSDGHHMEEDDEENDSITLQSKSPTVTSTTSANAKKHGMEDGVNGVSKKRRKKSSNGHDGDVQMTDAVPSPPLTEELPFTNGRSVGTQIEEPVEILKADTLVVEDWDQMVSENGDEKTMSCAWNPVVSTLLATSVRIWNVPEDATSSEVLEHVALSREPSRTGTDKAKVTAIRWSPEGNKLASGSFEGQTRIWSADGKLEYNMFLHSAPISSLKWNKSASILLTLSCDGKMIAWDAATGETHQVFDLEETVTDIEWFSESRFMACGESGNIHQLDIGVAKPLHSLLAHAGEVTCIAWDESTATVATGGCDASVSIWHKPNETSKPDALCKLQGHTLPVVSIAWQPGVEFIPASPKRLLASASDDCTIRLWDVVSQTCLRVLQRHADPIECICFSPDGSKLASGAYGGVLVWKVESGALTHVYDRARPHRKNGAEDSVETSGLSWDEGSQRLAIGEGATKCTVVRVCGPIAE
ncbi:WD40-repeat-containing domain protein [Sphaerosporella brunnea]|uniref:WD40-repeat-containing domain protein n=1 Tax=Sphaerosporella brunnea TaxID=1250544 RepID=A0A5J5EFC8_9PEZI|nr:WD40-repeat-containing domain protein [Sphaerosporella brunnea]KAA8893617.1 WD40-repeat-containing domain protein [Sphaerosporella brunnea]